MGKEASLMKIAILKYCNEFLFTKFLLRNRI